MPTNIATTFIAAANVTTASIFNIFLAHNQQPHPGTNSAYFAGKHGT